MSNYFISLRLQLLIQFVKDQQYPTKEDILSFFEDKDQAISKRTLERYIENIRADFGLEIEWSPKERGYFINEEKSIKVDSFFKLLEIIQIADIFSKGLKDSHQILEYVSFDDSKNFRGINLLKDFLLAINQERDISFIHENYERKSKKEYNITPLLLKEYLNRWYIIGAIPDSDAIRTFGIDRLSEVEIIGVSTKKRATYKEHLAKFNNVVGLTYNNNEPQKISLLVNELHVKYMRSLPLHNSQVIHPKNNKGQHQVDYHLIPNYEFETQILKIGKDVEVIYPESLRNKIINVLKSSLNKYL